MYLELCDNTNITSYVWLNGTKPENFGINVAPVKTIVCSYYISDFCDQLNLPLK